MGDHSGKPGSLRYRQIEYYRMPQLAFLAVDRPLDVSRNDFIRLALVLGPPDAAADTRTPYAEKRSRATLKGAFATTVSGAKAAPRPTRAMYAAATTSWCWAMQTAFFVNPERGVLAQFGISILLFLIAHSRRRRC